MLEASSYISVGAAENSKSGTLTLVTTEVSAARELELLQTRPRYGMAAPSGFLGLRVHCSRVLGTGERTST